MPATWQTSATADYVSGSILTARLWRGTHHDDEGRSARKLGIEASEDANDEGADGRRDIGPVSEDAAREVVARELAKVRVVSLRTPIVSLQDATHAGAADSNHVDCLLAQ